MMLLTRAIAVRVASLMAYTQQSHVSTHEKKSAEENGIEKA